MRGIRSRCLTNPNLYTALGFGLDNARAADARGAPQLLLTAALLGAAPAVDALAYAFAGAALLLLPYMLGTYMLGTFVASM